MPFPILQLRFGEEVQTSPLQRLPSRNDTRLRKRSIVRTREVLGVQKVLQTVQSAASGCQVAGIFIQVQEHRGLQGRGASNKRDAASVRCELPVAGSKETQQERVGERRWYGRVPNEPGPPIVRRVQHSDTANDFQLGEQQPTVCSKISPGLGEPIPVP